MKSKDRRKANDVREWVEETNKAVAKPVVRIKRELKFFSGLPPLRSGA